MIDLDEKRTFWSSIDVAKLLLEHRSGQSSIACSSVTALPDGISGRQILERFDMLTSIPKDDGYANR